MRTGRREHHLIPLSCTYDVTARGIDQVPQLNQSRPFALSCGSSDPTSLEVAGILLLTFVDVSEWFVLLGI